MTGTTNLSGKRLAAEPARRERIRATKAWFSKEPIPGGIALAASPSGRLSATATRVPTVDVSAAVAQAVRADRERILLILESPEAVGRERSARSLALATDDDAASVRRLLAKLQPDAAATESEVDAVVKKIVGFARPRMGAQTTPPRG